VRIAYLAVEFPTEENFDHGAGVSMGREVRALSGLGHEVAVLCWSERTERLSFCGMSLHRITRRLPLWARVIDRLTRRRFWALLLSRIMSRRMWNDFRELHGRQPFDVVVAASSAGVSHDTAKRANVPVVVRLSQYQPHWTALDGLNTLGTRIRDLFEVRALRHAGYIWTKSHHMAAVLRQETGLRADVIEPPFDVDVPEQDLTVLDKHGLTGLRYVLCLGPLGRRKGSDIIARAIPYVLGRDDGIHFVFVGTSRNLLDGHPPWERIQELAGDHARDNLHYFGKVPRPAMFALIEHALATVIAARTDNLPNASYETMGTGGILIATQNASFDQVVDDGVSGFLVPQENPAALAEVILRVARLSQEDRQRIADAAKTRIAEMSPDKAGRRLANYLQAVIR